MKLLLQRYALITASLGVLFASGIAAGYQWGRSQAAPAGAMTLSPQANGEITPEQWAENVAAALQKDLGLTAVQMEQARRGMAEPSRLIFEEKHRASLKIHLRLLETHDILARAVDLSDRQKSVLKHRRELLRKHIIDKFRDLIGDNPDPILTAL